MSDKEIRADAKLKNLREEDLETLWRFRYPEAEEGSEDAPPKKLTLEEIAALCPKHFGFSVSLASLSEFYRWLRLKKRMDGAAARAEQTRLELAKNPEFSPEDLDRAAQTVFIAETMEDGNVKGYVALARLRLASRQVDLDRRRIELLEKKAEFADLVKKAAENKAGGVTAEEMAEIERKLKMM